MIDERAKIFVREEQQFELRPAERSEIRLTAVGLFLAGILFILYPAIRPFSDETTLQGAAAFASPNWILAHTLAIVGFILMTLGLFGLYLLLQETSVKRTMFWGLVFSWVGIGLTLPFYGAEVFGLHALGQAALQQQNPALVGLANQVRFGPGIYVILTGLVLLAIGTIITAVAVWKSHVLPKWSGTLLALGFLLYIPQFIASQPIRIAHGVLVAAGCAWLAVAMWREV